jgi:hypothetical protein
VDIFCTGQKTFNVQVLHQLVLPTAGAVFLHRDFDAPFADNLFSALTRSTSNSIKFITERDR